MHFETLFRLIDAHSRLFSNRSSLLLRLACRNQQDRLIWNRVVIVERSSAPIRVGLGLSANAISRGTSGQPGLVILGDRPRPSHPLLTIIRTRVFIGRDDPARER